MNYEPHTWINREIITDEKMNHIEEGIYNEEERATDSEDYINQRIDDEIERATNAESTLSRSLANEVQRAREAEGSLDTAITNESSRATNRENEIEESLNTHTRDTDNPHNVTKSQVGLGNVGNFKAVSTEADQGLSNAEKANAKSNLGLGNVANLNFSDDTSKFLRDDGEWAEPSSSEASPEKMGFGYATCSTAAATTAKVATLANYVLTKNGIVSVKFTYAVPSNATLNINNQGAKPIYYKGSAITANIIEAGFICTFIYDGTAYELISFDRKSSGGGSSEVPDVGTETIVTSNNGLTTTHTYADGRVDTFTMAANGLSATKTIVLAGGTTYTQQYTFSADGNTVTIVTSQP